MAYVPDDEEDEEEEFVPAPIFRPVIILLERKEHNFLKHD